MKFQNSHLSPLEKIIEVPVIYSDVQKTSRTEVEGSDHCCWELKIKTKQKKTNKNKTYQHT